MAEPGGLWVWHRRWLHLSSLPLLRHAARVKLTRAEISEVQRYLRTRTLSACSTQATPRKASRKSLPCMDSGSKQDKTAKKECHVDSGDGNRKTRWCVRVAVGVSCGRKCFVASRWLWQELEQCSFKLSRKASNPFSNPSPEP